MSKHTELVQRAVTYDMQFVPRWSVPVSEAFVALLRTLDTGSATSVLVAEARTGFLASRVVQHLPERSRLMVVDPHAEMLDIARKRLAKAQQHIFYSTQEIHRLNYADGVFRVVACDAGLLTRSDLQAQGRELMRVVHPEGALLVSLPLRESFRCFPDMMAETSLRMGVRAVGEALEALRAEMLDEDSLLQAFEEAGMRAVGYQVVDLEMGFESAEALLFSPFVERLFLPRWLEVCADDTQQEPLFFDSTRALNTYFAGLELTARASVACVLLRPIAAVG